MMMMMIESFENVMMMKHFFDDQKLEKSLWLAQHFCFCRPKANSD
jgi:hypothetical protein